LRQNSGHNRYPFWLAQQGYTLMELVIAIIIIGVALPAIFSLYGQISVRAAQSALMNQMVAYAEDKLEEIIGKKESHWDWYKNPAQFAADENLGKGYRRIVTVNKITNWGNARIEAWEVQVKVTHPQLPRGFALSVRLTKYHEIK